MKLRGITIGLCSLAAAGAFTLLQAQTDTNAPPMGGPGMHHRGYGMHGPMMQHKMDRLSQQLNLTENQKLQVQGIFDQMRTNIMTAVDQARTNANQQLQQVLTPEQYQKWQQIMQQHEQRWRQHMTNDMDEGSETNETQGATGGAPGTPAPGTPGGTR